MGGHLEMKYSFINNHKSKEQLVLACECGSTLKMSGLNEIEIEEHKLMWSSNHNSHEQVECWEAARIRHSEWAKQRKVS